MGTSAGYDLTKLKPDGSHYVVVGFAIPHSLHLPDGNYPVPISNCAIPTFSRERPLTVQVVLEKKQKVLSQAEIHLAQRETWEMAGPHGTYGYSSILAYIPVRGTDSEIHQDFKKMWSLAEGNHPAYKEQAIIAVNQLIAVYRFCTGECHIRPLAGHDVRFEYSFALLFNQYPVDAHESKFLVYVLPIYNLFDRLPANLNIPDKVVSDVRTRLAESYQVPLTEELLLNAYDLIDRGNYRLAVIEAETAFEAAVISFLRGYFKDEPEKLREIEGTLSFGNLINRPFFEDALASKSKAFRKKESPRQEWDKNVWTVRGDLVHGRVQDVTYEDAINAVETVESTLEYLLGRNKTEPWRYAGPKILK
jgi:HEPN domain-containing protein